MGNFDYLEASWARVRFLPFSDENVQTTSEQRKSASLRSAKQANSPCCQGEGAAWLGQASAEREQATRPTKHRDISPRAYTASNDAGKGNRTMPWPHGSCYFDPSCPRGREWVEERATQGIGSDRAQMTAAAHRTEQGFCCETPAARTKRITSRSALGFREGG